MDNYTYVIDFSCCVYPTFQMATRGQKNKQINHHLVYVCSM